MSAAELLDTFGKAYQSSSKSVVGTTSSSGASLSDYKTPKTPATPNSTIPDLTRPPPGLSGAITSSNPPTTETPTYTPTTQAHYSQTYTPLDETSPKAPYAAAEPAYSPYDPTPNWAPPPPPPPPPPPELQRGTDRPAPEYDVTRNYNSTWSEFETYSASGDVNDDEADNRNWGEPPGNEELQALASDTPSSPPTFEKGFTGALLPPPLPPAFCARSNLRELVSEGKDSDQRTNLVNIQPKGEDSDYRCYDYSFLSDQAAEPKTEKTPSINSLFSSGDDLDLRVKKSGMKQSKDDSGSDMDISASGSEEDMEISDGSGKDAINKRGDKKAEKKNHSKESSKSLAHKKENNTNGTKSENVQSKKKASSNVPVSVENIKTSTNSKVPQNQPTSVPMKKSGSKTDDSATPSNVNDKKVSKVELVKGEKRKSVDSDGNSAKVQKTVNESGNSSKNDKKNSSDEGRDWYKNFNKAGEEKKTLEEPIPTVVPKTGGRGHINSRGTEETNVIDVIKSLDREFHQQRAKGNFNSNHNRGGGYQRDGGSPQRGNGGYFKGPKQHRGRGPGGQGFFSPHRGRGGPHALLPFGPSGRGYYGGHEPFNRGRGGRRALRGRGRW